MYQTELREPLQSSWEAVDLVEADESCLPTKADRLNRNAVRLTDKSVLDTTSSNNLQLVQLGILHM